MQSRLSLRERLVLLVLAAILPLAALSVWLVTREIDSTTELARTQLSFTASAVAAAQDRNAEAVHHLLGALAAMPEIRDPRPEVCTRRLSELRERFPVYANLGVVDGSGRVLCLAHGAVPGNDSSQRLFFQRALAHRDFVIGEADIGRASGIFSQTFAMPIIEAGQVVAVAFAALDLGLTTAALAANLDLPEGARITIADRFGQVLMLYPSSERRQPGERMTAPALLASAAALAPSSGEVEGVEGRRRIFAAVPSRLVAGEGVLAIVSQDRDLLLASAKRRMLEALAVISASLLLATALAWWIGGRVFLKPAKQILGAVRRIEHGYMHARVPLHDRNPRGEFAQLAAAFNLMAESLEMRQHDLEAELGRSREAFAVLDTVLNSMQEGLVAVDAEGRVLLFNTAATLLFDLREGDEVPLGDWPAHFGLHSADTGELLDAGSMSIARGLRGETGEALVLVRNDRAPGDRLLRCYYGPMRSDEGLVNGALAVFSDVTALQKAEADLRAFTAMLQRTAGAAQAISRHGSLEQTVREVEAQARHVVGVAHARLLLGGEKALARREPDVLAVPLSDSRGNDIGLLELAGKAEGSLGEREEYVAIELAQLAANAIENARLFERVRELNANLEKRIAERTAELARQSRLYRTLAEQAPEVVWNTDATGTRLTFLNRAWYELVGGTEADWIGGSGLGAVHPDDREAVSANWKHSRETLSTFAGVRRIRARDGSYHTMSYKGSPVLDDRGEVAFWVGIDSDITAQKAIEEALRSANQELEAFSYSVSHDLRAPLGAIDGFSKALASRLAGQVDEKGAHYLARIQAGVVRMEQLIEALLGLSRVARETMKPSAVDLTALARDTLEHLQAQDAQRRVTVRIEEGLVADGDPGLLRVMLENLLGNAWKFTSRTEAPLIELGRAGEGGAYFVRDNGVGFDMTYAGKLFTAFQRLHTEAEFPGTGIGLATVRRIVARHGGKVWAESAPGAGTTVWFTLQAG